MRNIHECVHEVGRKERMPLCVRRYYVMTFWTINHFVHVAEFKNVNDDTTGMTEEEKEHNGKQNQT